MGKRIPLQVSEGRLVLTAVIECKSLRIRKQIMDFVVDTGSPDSYISQKDVIKLQIPTKGKSSTSLIDFGGSRYQQITLPEFDFYLLKEDKIKNDYIHLKMSLFALKTTKTTMEKVQIGESLPSILGLDFLKEQNLSLHVILRENIAYLEAE